MDANETIVSYCAAREDFTDITTPQVLAALQAEFPQASVDEFVAALREAASQQFAHADELEAEGRPANDT